MNISVYLLVALLCNDLIYIGMHLHVIYKGCHSNLRYIQQGHQVLKYPPTNPGYLTFNITQ